MQEVGQEGVSKTARDMDPLQRAERAAREEAARRQAQLDAQARERARRDFQANQRLQEVLRGYERILRRLDKAEARRKAKINRQIEKVKRQLARRET